MSRLIITSVLDGWKAVGGDGDETDPLWDDTYSEITDLGDALRQIAHLRAAITQKQIEIDVLVEALEYARSIRPRTCGHE
jgi:hypothetical protein